jgi:uncharacterized protein (DUF302 family)
MTRSFDALQQRRLPPNGKIHAERRAKHLDAFSERIVVMMGKLSITALLMLIALGVAPMNNTLAAESGVVRIASQHSVATTAQRLAALLEEHGIRIFARVDFSGDAARAGLAMRPEQLFIFGNPKAGTPLMQAEPTAGLDLPLKALIWEDPQGRAWIAYNDPQYVLRRHGLAAALSANIVAVIPLLQRAAQE